MVNFQIIIMVFVVLLSFVGGFYNLRVVACLKEGKRGSVWTGRWLFHPEWLDESGRKDRKRVILVLSIEFILLGIFSMTT